MINSLTHEPISRALVYSPDNRFATLSDSEGRFEFKLPKADSTAPGDSNENSVQGSTAHFAPPYMLTVRKPGFMPDPNNPGNDLMNDPARELTIGLVPESVVAGTVRFPGSEAPERIFLELLRRQVQNGYATWVPAGGTRSASDGQFRFSGLTSGTYKLVTKELLDRDQVSVGPIGPSFGYAPVYYQNATDLASATPVELGPGQTQTVDFTLARQPYYELKLPVIWPTSRVEANNPRDDGVNIDVYAAGHRASEFTLGYNSSLGVIEGLLPNGTYTIEATNSGANPVAGVRTITIKGGPLNTPATAPSVILVPTSPISVSVREEFSSPVNATKSWTINGRTVTAKGPRRYLSVSLQSADDGRRGRAVSLREPSSANDETLTIDPPAPGSYWVQVSSAHGYAAAVRSGNVDLLHQPLVVASGAPTAPIEITMRDDTAEISGNVEGMTSSSAAGEIGTGGTFYKRVGPQSGARVYCVPLPDSPGQFAELWVAPNGNFIGSALAPGEYRLLAFDRAQPNLEYHNQEAMRAYEAKGPAIHASGGQKEHVTLQLISTSSLTKEP